jgi:hypothetical protein
MNEPLDWPPAAQEFDDACTQRNWMQDRANTLYNL